MKNIYIHEICQNSRSGKSNGAIKDHMKSPPVNHSVHIRTHTDGQPTSTSSSDSVPALVHPVRSIPEYMLARANIMWKNE